MPRPAATPSQPPRPQPQRPRRFARRAAIFIVAVILVWLACAFWNFVKPLPAGTRVASLPARLAESQVDFLDGRSSPRITRQRELLSIDRAAQMIVIDRCPLDQELAQHLLARKRQRPNLKIVVVTDPRDEAYGGTPAPTLRALEASGIIVARVRLERLRDPDPLYSSLWRLTVAWWDDPFDEVPDEVLTSLRRLNFKFDRRQLLVADDGAGGWSSIATSAEPGIGASGNAGLELQGPLAREMADSELQIAAWSTDDDRLPPPPPLENRGVGTIDARLLTESAIRTALRDAIAVAGSGDSIDVAVHEIGERRIVGALLQAVARGARLQLLLDPAPPANRAVAAELLRNGAGSMEVRWRSSGAGAGGFVLIRHGNDAWLNVGSADLTRQSLDDLNLAANLELRLPLRAAPARAAADSFAQGWSSAEPYAVHADESEGLYWQYRLADVTGLALF